MTMDEVVSKISGYIDADIEKKNERKKSYGVS